MHRRSLVDHGNVVSISGLGGVVIGVQCSAFSVQGCLMSRKAGQV